MLKRRVAVLVAVTVLALIVLGRAGDTLVDWLWFSSIGYVGVYDAATQKFVPPPLSHQERMTAANEIVQLPAGWNFGAISTAR